MARAAAPVLRPTHDEWRDFASYVRKIEPEIVRFGGCQVIPPTEWVHNATRERAKEVKHKTTQITPIRQHVAGRDGRFQAVMEWCDAMPLNEFVENAQASETAIHKSSPDELDARFWRSAAARPSPLYGADTSEAGSLFDPSLSEWNLGALPGGVDNDLTQELPMAIPGLNQSMLYFGQWRSFFALHTEDCELQGASYLHWGAPKRWYIVPPSHAARVRSLAAANFPELQQSCPNFLRHKTTLFSPAVLKASNIPCYSVLQTEGTFVIVCASAFHFGFNHGANCAEAVNFGLSEWLPLARKARPCTCQGQTPHIDIPLLVRRVKTAHPVDAKDWWCFSCACGQMCTNFDADEETSLEGEQFECVGCGLWGHLDCYPEYKAAAAEGSLPDALYCISCKDAWIDSEHSDDRWVFSCVCGRNEGASNETAATGDSPTGRMFACSSCGVWSHTECYDVYRDVDDDQLPEHMSCHRCCKKVGTASVGSSRHTTPVTPKAAKRPRGAAGTPKASADGKRAKAGVPAVVPSQLRSRPVPRADSRRH